MLYLISRYSLCIYLERSGSRCGSHQFNGGMCTATEADLKHRSSLYYVFLRSIDRVGGREVEYRCLNSQRYG
jgi:hypothetical protein